MSDSTFGQLWRRLLIYAPDLPVTLAQEMINTAYSRAICAYTWSNLRGSGAFRLAAPYTTGTITVTNGSSTVTGASTVWTTALEGMQLVIGGAGPFWEVASVDAGAQTLTLASPYVGADVSASAYSIQQINLVMPSDFGWLTTFVDVTSTAYWTLSWLYKQETIDVLDPRRLVSTAQPLYLFGTTPSPFSSTSGRSRYELWPRPTGAKTYFYRYTKKPPLMSAESDAPIAPIRGDVIREGAMAELRMWRGTGDWENPAYDLNAAQMHEKRFLDRLSQCRLEDQNIIVSDVEYEEDWKRLIPSGSFWQNATISWP